MKNNGFTLVEVIVTITIIGIVTLVALPVINVISNNLDTHKEKVCLESITTGAKLYIDSHLEDEFGYQDEGCVLLTYDKISQYTKDPDFTECKIDTNNVYIKVSKNHDTINYETLYKKDATEIEAELNNCGDSISSSGPVISLHPRENANPVQSSKLNVAAKINSNFGLTANQEIKYQWYKEDGTTKIGSEETLSYVNQLRTGVSELSKNIKIPNVNGKVQVKITPVNVMDTTSQKTTEIYNSGLYLLDNKVPTLTTSTVVSKTDNLTFKAKDNNGLAAYAITTSTSTPQDSKWQALTSNPDEEKTVVKSMPKGVYYVHVKDKAGNTTYKKQEVVRMTEPTCTIKLTGTKTGNWYTSNVGVTLNITGETSTTGLDTTKNSKNNKTTVTHSTNTSSVTYYGYVENEEGSNTCSATFKVDKGPSKPTVNLNGYTQGSMSTGNVKMTLTTTSDYKISKWQYSHDNSSWNDNIGNWSATYSNDRRTINATISWSGSWYFYVRAIDENGVPSPSSNRFQIKVDKGPSKPSINLNGYGSGSWTNGNVTISASTSSTYKIKQWEYSHNPNGGWNTNIQNWSASFSNDKRNISSILNWDGQWTFYVRAVDEYGVASPPSDSFIIRRDTTCPQVSYRLECGSHFAGYPNHNAATYVKMTDYGAGLWSRNITWGDNTQGVNRYTSGWTRIYGNEYEDLLGSEGSWQHFRLEVCDGLNNCCTHERQYNYSC